MRANRTRVRDTKTRSACGAGNLRAARRKAILSQVPADFGSAASRQPAKSEPWRARFLFLVCGLRTTAHGLAVRQCNLLASCRR